MNPTTATAAALLCLLASVPVCANAADSVPETPASAGAPVVTDEPLIPVQSGDLPQQAIRELRVGGARDLTERPASLWARIRNGFAMPNLNTPAVREQEDFYANRPEHIRRVVERSRRYLFHIVEEIERRGMPSELALLPIIESAFNPVALSPAQAAGIWQFIPSTGQSFGLTQNWWIDGRRDIVMATGAALDYLQKLYGMFGTWELALAAYNCGAGCVQRAIQRNALRGERIDFSSLPLPAETRAYVPRLQAVKNIIADPQQFNIALPDIRNEPFFGSVRVQQHVDVKVAAKLAGMTVEEFLLLNPAHNRPVINANKHSTLLLPLDRLDQFTANLGAAERLSAWQIYSPRNGEALESVARRFRIPLAQLRQVNGIPARVRLASGERDLLVPSGPGVTTEPALHALRAPPPAGRAAAAAPRSAPRLAAAAPRSTPAGDRQLAPARPSAAQTRTSPGSRPPSAARRPQIAQAPRGSTNARGAPTRPPATASGQRLAAAQPASSPRRVHVAQNQRPNGNGQKLR